MEIYRHCVSGNSGLLVIQVSEFSVCVFMYVCLYHTSSEDQRHR